MLAVGQTLGFACLFYIFAALVTDWRVSLGWDTTLLAVGPMIAILVSATLAPLFGRFVDRGFGPELLTAGPLLGAAALAGLAAVQTPAQYLAAWAVIGVAHGASLYEVCFAWLVRRLGARARPAIIKVTLVAGFASTLAFPAGALLADGLGWRGAVLVAAAVMACVTAPLNHVAGRRLRRGVPRRPTSATVEADRGGLGRALARPMFWGLAAVFMLVNLNHWMVVNLMVPVLTAKGLAEGAAILAAACIGPAQVAGRIALMRYESRLSNAAVARATMAALVVGGALLMAAGAGVWLAIAYALAQGAAMGIVTILRPVLVSERLGQTAFGAVAGAIAIPPLLASAAAPALGALLLDRGGPDLVSATAFGLALAALALTALILSRPPAEG
jgi:MFS family permease